jgi:hypothetical protein
MLRMKWAKASAAPRSDDGFRARLSSLRLARGGTDFAHVGKTADPMYGRISNRSDC